MKQKIVIKLSLHSQKCKKKAMKIAATASGVSSVKIDKEKDEMVVIGDGVDSASLTNSLRKKVGCADIVSLEEVKGGGKSSGTGVGGDNQNMKQKIVIKLSLHCQKCKKKAMKIAATASGVSSVKIDKEKDEMVVIGDGVDSASLTNSLRKKVGCADIVSLEEVKGGGESSGTGVGGDNQIPVIEKWPTFYDYYQQPPHLYHLYQNVCEPNPTPCSVM